MNDRIKSCNEIAGAAYTDIVSDGGLDPRNEPAPKAEQPPVQESIGYVSGHLINGRVVCEFNSLPRLGTKLYAAPQPSDDVAMLRKQLDEARELLNNARNKINYMRQNGEWYYPERLLDRIDAWLEANK